MFRRMDNQNNRLKNEASSPNTFYQDPDKYACMYMYMYMYQMSLMPMYEYKESFLFNYGTELVSGDY